MTPKLYDLLKGTQKMQLNRLRRVMVEGSPKYHYDVPVIAADYAYVEFNTQTEYPRSRKYEPLDSCLVINNDAVMIGMRFNGSGSDLYLIPAGTIRRISREEVGAIWHVRIINHDTANATTLHAIDIELWRAPEDADSIARRSL